MAVDFGRAADDYARHRAGFPPALFERLAQYGVGGAGQRVLDLGTGTGTLARGFAARGCDVLALDIATPLLVQARRLDREAGVQAAQLRARAEATPFADGRFDVVSAGQCWHWFDRPRVAAEARRLLRSGGAFVITYFDWVALPGSVAEATEALIEQHNSAWAFRGMSELHLHHLNEMAAAGFADRQCFAFDVAVRYTQADWRGRIRASAGVGAYLADDAAARFDEAHALMLQRFTDPLQVPHRVFALIAR